MDRDLYTDEQGVLRCEFYVSSGNKDLIRHLSDIMKRQGYIGLADGGGRMHYVVDGSKNLYETASNIRMILRENEANLLSSAEPLRMRELRRKRLAMIEDYLESKGLKSNLKGFVYLRFILERLLESGEDFPNVSKELYAEMCERYQTGRKAADRVIHYVLMKAGIEISNSEAVALFADDLNKSWQQFLAEEEEELPGPLPPLPPEAEAEGEK